MKLKRIFSIALVTMMLLSVMNVSVMAAGMTDEELVDTFTDEVFSLSNTDQFVELVLLLESINDPSGFSDTYSSALGMLLTSQQQRLESYQLTNDAVTSFAQFMQDDVFSEEEFEDNLSEDTTENREAFAANISERVDDFRASLSSELDQSALEAGFAQMDKVFSMLSLYQASSLDFSFLDAEEENGDFTLDEEDALEFIDIANDVLGDDIESTDPVLEGLDEFVAYYNDLDQSDKTAVYSYLDDYNLVSLTETSSGGGGGGGTSSTEEEEETTPEDTTTEDTTEDVQASVDEQSKVEVQAEVSEDKISASVSTTDLSSAFEKAKQAVESLTDTTSKKAVKKKAVLEIPTTENVKKVAATLPVQDVKNLEKEGLEAVQIKSQVGSIELDMASILDEDQEANEVAIEMNDVSEDAGIDVPEGSVVVDFNLSVDGQSVKSFKKPIKVSIPYTPKDGDDLDEITVYFLQDDGTSVPVGGVYNPKTGLVDFTTNHFSKYYAKKARASFNDVASTHWAVNYVEILGGKGIINGKGNGQFDPSADITRAEFVALITRMLSLVDTNEAMPFTDVESTAWYATELPVAYQAGLINGKSSTTFAPNESITRQEAAVVIANTLEYLGYELETDSSLIADTFNDNDTIASWADEAVASVYREKIMNGKPGDVFDPTGNATRAEVAKMIFTLMKK